jgi:hypothetical protein
MRIHNTEEEECQHMLNRGKNRENCERKRKKEAGVYILEMSPPLGRGNIS